MWHPNIYEVKAHIHTFIIGLWNQSDCPLVMGFTAVKWVTLIFQNGDVCISILHPPVDDPQSGELPSERWNPTQNVRFVHFLHLASPKLSTSVSQWEKKKLFLLIVFIKTPKSIILVLRSSWIYTCQAKVGRYFVKKITQSLYISNAYANKW